MSLLLFPGHESTLQAGVRSSSSGFSAELFRFALRTGVFGNPGRFLLRKRIKAMMPGVEITPID
jgi:hypothetical protein